MRIYPAEIKDNINFSLNNKDGSSAIVTAKARISDLKKYFDGMPIENLFPTSATVTSVEELLGQEQPDLALLVAILVSTGWNLNDDIFLPEEVWKARLTPLHKPINDNHQANQILGHIVQSRVLDKDGNEILDNKKLPDKFDIEVAGVLYKQFPGLMSRIDEIISKAQADEIFVSMEAWFPNFDYGFINPKTNEIKVVERTNETAFLTKHLVAYGGNGKYQEYQIGRILRDIIFGAQGIVDVPANPESIIKVAANQNIKSSNFVTAKVSEFLEGGVVDVDENQVNEMKTKLQDAQAELVKKDEELTKLQEEIAEFKKSNNNDYEDQITTFKTEIDELTNSLSKASKEIDAIKVERDELNKSLTKITERTEKAESELNKIKKDQIAHDRLVKLLEVKKVENEDATLAEVREMTDETFALILKYAGDNKKGDVELSEASLDCVEVEEDADLNINSKTSKGDQWLATAQALCGRKEKKD
ncbi:MAG: hypothetical protein JSW11_00280 [Candidatus Heimdallarchaeota archaeon]|nr:MAG: hypothetical protein JSW11_00280 [Candidatus Heimdallarchaeota archaeon]